MSGIHDIVVFVHNGMEEEVINCLNSLVLHKSKNFPGRVIVVDDASDAPTANALLDFGSRHEEILLHRLDTQNFYTRAANIGLKLSRAKYITLINGCVLVSKGWEEGILSVFASCDEIGIVGPLSNAAGSQSVMDVNSSESQTVINSLPPSVRAEQFAEFVRTSQMDMPYPYVPLIEGSCMTVSRAVIEEIGYFDESTFSSGCCVENDFCFRADDAGFILAVAINVFVFHQSSLSYSEAVMRGECMQAGLVKLKERYGSNRIEYSFKYMENNPSLEFARNSVTGRRPDFCLA